MPDYAMTVTRNIAFDSENQNVNFQLTFQNVSGATIASPSIPLAMAITKNGSSDSTLVTIDSSSEVISVVSPAVSGTVVTSGYGSLDDDESFTTEITIDSTYFDAWVLSFSVQETSGDTGNQRFVLADYRRIKG